MPKHAAPDPLAPLREGERWLQIGSLEKAEAAFRRAVGTEAPQDIVNAKLQSVVSTIARRYDDPGALALPPGDGRDNPFSGAELDAMLAGVNRALARVPAVMPSKFWVSHAEQHVTLLRKWGMNNFKRTVAHNYYNWLTIDVRDPQIARLLTLWPLHGSSEALTDTMEELIKSDHLSGINALQSANGLLYYRLGVSLLWDYTLHTDHHGVLRRLGEPLTGNPLRVMRRGRVLSQDLAHSVRERNRIVDHAGIDPASDEPVVIGELGAGNGRLAHMFAMTTNCRYMIFDIAPALLVSQWYIRTLFPDENIFTFREFDSWDEIAEELAGCRFAFFASSQLEKLPPKYFDLFINVCSLMEMRPDTIAYFFRQIERTTRSHFYTKQWLIQNNREDDVVIRREDYPVPPAWTRLYDGIDPINQRLFEEVWAIR